MAQDRTQYNAYVAQLKEQLIIPIEQISATSMLDLNISEDKLIFAVVNSQKIYLEPLIGSALTRKLQGNDLTFEYELLLERFLNDALINWGVSECIQGLAYQVAQGGIFRHESTDSELPTPAEISTIRQSYLYKGDTFGRRLIDFLNKNSSYYPEYSENSGDGLNADKINKFTGALLVETGYECGGGVGNADADVFLAQTNWGNSDEVDMGFDPNTLSGASNEVPSYVLAQPINDYFWVVSEVKLYPAQMGIRIPTVEFTDINVETEIFVSGEQDDLFWLRIKIKETYEQAVTFELQL
jgi:hypothetical protein